MATLSSKKILQEKNTNDPNSITSLTLTHKALTDVSCLGEFKNLERLDLGFNNLTSLEGLKSCTNLKWLSVVQNKLQSLKGIDGLNRLTVLNAGKNKLKSMDEVKSLSSLRALILNDNEISSVCKLDQMKELNTLVLSRNPVRSLGESLLKLKSITKLSLSNCQLQKVDSSLRSCLELKELRLAHNEITTIPTEFGDLVKLQNLDLGNNEIARWSNLKVLSSLVNLRNLNLQGNPIAEKENLLKKVSSVSCNKLFCRPLRLCRLRLQSDTSNDRITDIYQLKKLLPNLHVFNARPIDKITAKEVHANAFDFSVETKQDQPTRNNRKDLQDEKDVDNADNTNDSEKKKKKKMKLQEDEIRIKDTVEALNGNPEEIKGIKQKKKRSRETTKGETVNIVDTGVLEDYAEDANDNLDRKKNGAIEPMSIVVTYPTKKNKKESFIDPSLLALSHVDEIGLGGRSAWGV